MSNSAVLKGGATLFLTTLTLVSLPMASSPLLDGAGAANVQAHRSVELECVAAGGGFGGAEHHADLHSDLVDEDDHAVGLLDGGSAACARLGS
jgi:hypothetical protein